MIEYSNAFPAGRDMGPQRGLVKRLGRQQGQEASFNRSAEKILNRSRYCRIAKQK